MVFHAYDIRGIYRKDIDTEFARRLASSFILFLGKKRPKLIVGKDVQIHNKPLYNALYEGLVDHSAEVFILGTVPTPLFCFSDLYGFDDAIFVTLKMAKVLSIEGAKLSKLVDPIPRLPSSPVYVVEVSDELKPIIIEKAAQKLYSLGFKVSRVDGVKAFSPDGWILIRPSNTMPQVKYRVEGKDEGVLRHLLGLARSIIEESMGRK